MRSVISSGTKVTPSRAAKNIENVLVNASGLNRRPSCAVSEKTGIKLTVITSNEKKSGRPTVLAALMMTADRESVSASGASEREDFEAAHISSHLWAFSTMIMAASTIAPMAMAIPPSDMMLEVRPRKYIGRNDRTMAIGSVM